jgi:hypothetical protein
LINPLEYGYKPSFMPLPTFQFPRLWVHPFKTAQDTVRVGLGKRFLVRAQVWSQWADEIALKGRS